MSANYMEAFLDTGQQNPKLNVATVTQGFVRETIRNSKHHTAAWKKLCDTVKESRAVRTEQDWTGY